MERAQILETMSGLKLFGMRAAYHYSCMLRLR